MLFSQGENSNVFSFAGRDKFALRCIDIVKAGVVQASGKDDCKLFFMWAYPNWKMLPLVLSVLSDAYLH